MSREETEELFLIGKRIREERERLGLSQEAFGTRIGTTGRTIKKYEGNETSPRADHLLMMYRDGVDVLYVVTGTRLPPGVCEPPAAYSVARRLANEIAERTLNDSDAELLRALAERLSKDS